MSRSTSVIVADAQITTGLVLFDVSGTDGDDDLHVVRMVSSIRILLSGWKPGSSTGGVVVIKSLPPNSRYSLPPNWLMRWRMCSACRARYFSLSNPIFTVISPFYITILLYTAAPSGKSLFGDFPFRISSDFCGGILVKNPPLLFFPAAGILNDTPMKEEPHHAFSGDVEKTHLPPDYRPFFETDSIDEAKDFAMRLAFDETNRLCAGYPADEIVRFRRPGVPGLTGPPIRPFAPVLSVRTGLFICV